MTIRTMCEICGKVVAYTDPNQQAFEAINNPDQFCECMIDAEHIKSLMEEGYTINEVAETMNHSRDWVQKRIDLAEQSA